MDFFCSKSSASSAPAAAPIVPLWDSILAKQKKALSCTWQYHLNCTQKVHTAAGEGAQLRTIFR